MSRFTAGLLSTAM